MKVILMCMMLFNISGFASNSQQLLLKPGAKSLQADLEKDISETKYRIETVPKTCYNQESYQDYVCRDVIKYRTQTRHKTCNRTESYNDQVCNNVPRSRRTCRTENNKVCRNVPTSKQVCTNLPSKRVCRTINGRRVCSNTPGGRKCRTVTHNRKECTNNPRQVCRNQSYSERVCKNVKRTRTISYDCSTTEQVPYTDNVCEYETKYKDVVYDCSYEEQVPYTVNTNYKAQIDIEIKGQSQEEHQLKVSITNNAGISLKQINKTKNYIEVVSKDVKESNVTGGKLLKAKYVVKIVRVSKKSFNQIIFTDPDYSESQKQLTLTVTENLSKISPLEVKLYHKNGNKLITSFQILPEDIGENQLFLPIDKAAIEKVNAGDFLKVKVSKDFSKVINPKPEPLSKTFEFSSIRVK